MPTMVARRGTAAQELGKKIVNMITPQNGAWQHTSVRALLVGVHQTKKEHRKQQKTPLKG